MTLKDIVAKLTGLDARISAADRAEVDALKNAVNGEVARLTAELATVQTELAASVKLSGEYRDKLEAATNASNAANSKLASFLTGLGNTPAADATLAQNADAVTHAVSAAIASQGIEKAELPAAEIPQQSKPELFGLARVHAAFKSK